MQFIQSKFSLISESTILQVIIIVGVCLLLHVLPNPMCVGASVCMCACIRYGDEKVNKVVLLQ